jgi:hypothetical protein
VKTTSNWGKLNAIVLLAITGFLLAGCGASGSTSGSGSGDWYYHWNCNGDSECLATNPTGQPSGTLNEGPNESSCTELLTFAQHFWGSAATNSCDQSSSGSGSGGSGGNTSAPTITSFSPMVGAPGDTITVAGTNFPTSSCQNIVTINNQTAPATCISSTSLSFTVPYILNTTSPIVITTSGGMATSSLTFSIINDLYAVASSGTQFVAVGESGTILTSLDGVSWTERTSNMPGGYYIDGITWSGSQYVAVGGAGYTLTSSDGVTWSVANPVTSNALYAVAFSGTTYVAVGNAGTILTSSDGKNWTQQSSGLTTNLNAVTWTGNQFVAVGDSGRILTSLNGTTWISQTSNTTDTLLDVTQSSSTNIVAVGGTSSTATVDSSSNGSTWNLQTAGTSNYLRGVTWSGTQFVAVGKLGTFMTSPTGITWTQQSPTAAGGKELWGVTWGGSQFVAVGVGTIILTSPDGVGWTSR